MTQKFDEADFEAEQARHAAWRRGQGGSDADARLFDRLARLPAPAFPTGFTARVLQQRREQARETARFAALLIVLAVVAAAICLVIAWPVLSLRALVPWIDLVVQSHAAGAVVAMGAASWLGHRLGKARLQPE